MTYLTRRDLYVFEKLTDSHLDDTLKDYLLKFYGKGGEVEQVQKAQTLAAATCDGACWECCYCQSFCQAPLLDQLLVITEAWDRGIFCVVHDNYESAKNKLLHAKWEEEQLMWF